MVSKRDIFATAKLLIKQHGSNAEDVATKKYFIYLKQDDVKGASVWLEIMSAINDLKMRNQQKHLH